MKLYYYKDPAGNFGDDLNPLIWNHFIPEMIDADNSALFVGIGTIINNRVPQDPKKLVFGSGVGYGPLPIVDEKWNFSCVRGPLSAQKLNLDPSLAITDPAVLLKLIESDIPTNNNPSVVSYIPHHRSVENANWKLICSQADIAYIDPTAPIQEVIKKIRESKLVIAEAMHGAIVADAFRIPWIPAVCYDHILDFKWMDWCKSLNLTYSPTRLPGLWDKVPAVTLSTKFKSEIKRNLMRIGVSSSNWSPPSPRISNPAMYDRAVADLQKLKNCHVSFLSKDKEHSLSIERLLVKLYEVKKEFTADFRNI